MLKLGPSRQANAACLGRRPTLIPVSLATLSSYGLAAYTLFAATDTKSQLDAMARSTYKWDASDALLMLGILVVLASLMFFWAYYVRRRPRDKHGAPILSSRKDEDEDEDPSRRRVRVRRKRRRHHPDNFPRNPTLGETGGLPPLRPEEESVPPNGDGNPPQAKV